MSHKNLHRNPKTTYGNYTGIPPKHAKNSPLFGSSGRKKHSLLKARLRLVDVFFPEIFFLFFGRA